MKYERRKLTSDIIKITGMIKAKVYPPNI